MPHVFPVASASVFQLHFTFGVYVHVAMPKNVLQGAESNVRVNAVAPGHVTTPIYGDVPDEALAGMSKANHIIERPLKPEEVR